MKSSKAPSSNGGVSVSGLANYAQRQQQRGTYKSLSTAPKLSTKQAATIRKKANRALGL